ncbi:MAG: hypothetical protein K2K09_07680, partial [Lachnospiraceae bacterium]|nr:hypothetical protein [Lachnospiraceae bacterium]
MKNLIFLLVVAVCIFIIWFASYLSSMISNKLSDGKANLFYNVLVAVLFAAAVGLRIYYILTHGDVLAIDGFNLFHEELMMTAACALGMAKLIIIYMIGLYAFGKQGAAATLFFEGFLASEIRSCMVLDYANISVFIVLVVILLYSIYFKRCNSENMNTVMSWILTAFITVIISAGIGVSVYFGYSIVIPVVLAVSVILNMLFAGWKQALLPVIGIPALCIAAYFGVSIIDADYSERFNSEIEQCISNAGQLFESPADMFSNIRDYADSSVMPDDDLTFTIPGGYEYNNDVFINMILMCLTLWSLILLFFKKRSSLSVYILFSFGIYLYDGNIMLCNVFILGLCFQELYEGRDRISYVVNSPFIDEVNDEVADYPVYDDSEAENPISEAAVSDENVAQIHEDSSTSVDSQAGDDGLVSEDRSVYEYNSMSESSSESEDSAVSADAVTSEDNSVYGVSEPEPQEYTESGYGVTEPLNYTGSQYGAYNAEDYAGSDSGANEPQNYTGSNYGAVDTKEYSGSGYGTDEPQNYSGSNYGCSLYTA